MKTMAEVLSQHWGHHCGKDKCVCDCGETILHWGAEHAPDQGGLAAHQEAMLTAAGFGLLADAFEDGVFACVTAVANDVAPINPYRAG